MWVQFINWHQQLLKLDNIYGQHHLQIDVDSLFIPRKHGGRFLMQFEKAYAVR